MKGRWGRDRWRLVSHSIQQRVGSMGMNCIKPFQGIWGLLGLFPGVAATERQPRAVVCNAFGVRNGGARIEDCGPRSGAGRGWFELWKGGGGE
jgi:hypothetical protein